MHYKQHHSSYGSGHFYGLMERLPNSQLKGRPLLVDGTSDRGVVATCSYETRGFGVHSGMPI